MTADIIGIDVTVEFADRVKATGHISPDGVHVARDQDKRIRPVLEEMREAILDDLKPYRRTK
jgi:hypothetical protein